jgi:hypothetical protein
MVTCELCERSFGRKRSVTIPPAVSKKYTGVSQSIQYRLGQIEVRSNKHIGYITFNDVGHSQLSY